MQSIRQIQRLNDAELQKCVPPNASWHTDYRDTAYVYIGGLPFELSEGDVLTIFSQYGNPVHIHLVRDKDTGKSRGFAFLKYEDQRSCDLAVDNLSGAGVLGRTLTVDHTRYKLKEGEIEGEGLEEVAPDDGDETDREGEQRRKRQRTSSVDEQRPMLKEEIELANLLKEHDDDDPMKAYLVQEKKEEVAEALRNLSMDTKEKTKYRHRSGRHDRDDEKRHRHKRRGSDEHTRIEKDGHNARYRGDRSRERQHRHSRRDDSEDRVRSLSIEPQNKSTRAKDARRETNGSSRRHRHRAESSSRSRSPETRPRQRSRSEDATTRRRERSRS